MPYSGSPEVRRFKMREYYWRTHEQSLKRNRRSLENNREKNSARQKKYYWSHREEQLRWHAENRKRNLERHRQKDRDRYWSNRDRLLVLDTLRRADPVRKQEAVSRTRNWERYCQACRQDLRSLVEQMPAVAKALGVPNLESATDGQVRKFYDNMMEQLKHGNFNIENNRNRKGASQKASPRRTIRGSRP